MEHLISLTSFVKLRLTPSRFEKAGIVPRGTLNQFDLIRQAALDTFPRGVGLECMGSLEQDARFEWNEPLECKENFDNT